MLKHIPIVINLMLLLIKIFNFSKKVISEYYERIL
jgi:hypothetical protein